MPIRGLVVTVSVFAGYVCSQLNILMVVWVNFQYFDREEKDCFKEFMEDYNTATLPHKKVPHAPHIDWPSL